MNKKTTKNILKMEDVSIGLTRRPTPANWDHRPLLPSPSLSHTCAFLFENKPLDVNCKYYFHLLLHPVVLPLSQSKILHSNIQWWCCFTKILVFQCTNSTLCSVDNDNEMLWYSELWFPISKFVSSSKVETLRRSFSQFQKWFFPQLRRQPTPFIWLPIWPICGENSNWRHLHHNW